MIQYFEQDRDGAYSAKDLAGVTVDVSKSTLGWEASYLGDPLKRNQYDRDGRSATCPTLRINRGFRTRGMAATAGIAAYKAEWGIVDILNPHLAGREARMTRVSAGMLTAYVCGCMTVRDAEEQFNAYVKARGYEPDGSVETHQVSDAERATICTRLNC